MLSCFRDVFVSPPPALLFLLFVVRLAFLCTLGSSAALLLLLEKCTRTVHMYWENNAFFASLFPLSARVCMIDNVTRIS